MIKKVLSMIMASALVVSLVACGNSATQSQGANADGVNEVASNATGKVYYLNFKPEQDAAWQVLAKKYTEQTGVPVTVVTAASGNYETTLMSEMGKSSAPTLFQVNGPVSLVNWTDTCMDLKGTELYNQLTSDSFALKDGNKVCGIGYVIESYGIIANKTLLASAGYDVNDIKSFETLKSVAEDITARKDELGFSAFSSAGMDGSSDWRFKTHLANLPIYFEYQKDGINNTGKIKGTYLDNYKKIWDLYINNSTCDPKDLSAKTGDDSRNEFLNGNAAFFQNGSWEYGNLVGAGKYTDDDLQMIPIYIGVGDEANQGLCTGTENYWCINDTASEDDKKATLDFVTWCVSSVDGTSAMGKDMGFVIPFKNAVEPVNVFVKQDTEYTNSGKKPVSWNFTTMPSEQWKDDVGFALKDYAANQTDEKWQAVVNAFVDGWEKEYNLSH